AIKRSSRTRYLNLLLTGVFFISGVVLWGIPLPYYFRQNDPGYYLLSALLIFCLASGLFITYRILKIRLAKFAAFALALVVLSLLYFGFNHLYQWRINRVMANEGIFCKARVMDVGTSKGKYYFVAAYTFGGTTYYTLRERDYSKKLIPDDSVNMMISTKNP